MTRRMARVLGGTAAAVLLCVCTSYGQTLQPCQDNCIQVSVGTPTPAGPYNVGDMVRVPIDFQQASGAGVGEIAALALTLNIPGLQLANCDNPDANGITSAIEVPASVADMYRVVVENTSCTDDPTRPCLCPGTGQQLADHVNIVVFGPKDLPTPGSGAPTIPLLPSDELVALNLKVRSDAAATTLLHLFAETDDASAPPKPSFSAYLSVGDSSAVDETANRDTGVSKVVTADQTLEIINNSFLVCDVSPSTGDDAGLFGNSTINNSDIVAIFKASLLGPPPSDTARFSAMDSITEDSPPMCGGDGSIKNNDVVACFKRSLLPSLPRYNRQGLGASCTSSQL